MANSSIESPVASPAPPLKWAPAWVIACVAAWPAPGIAEALLALGALVMLGYLAWQRFTGDGRRLLSVPAWALTSTLFLAYWLPQLVSAVDADDPGRAWGRVAAGLRHLPFMWLVAIAVANDARRRATFTGLGVVVALWVADALAQALAGSSPLFWSMDQVKWLVSGHGLCSAGEAAQADRLSGVFGPCNLKFGQVLASLTPFLLFAAAARWGRWGWLLAALPTGVVIVLAGSRASWITYALVMLFSGWRLLGRKGMALVLLSGLLGAVLLAGLSPQVRERVTRTAMALTGDAAGVDAALSGRSQIWSAAACMVRAHPLNGVGTREFRNAFPQCDPAHGQYAAWGTGPALHAHQLVLEILSETGILGLLLWLAGASMAWRAWRYADVEARARARPATLALAVTVFPFNTHLAFYSAFWGGATLLLAALFAGALLAHPSPAPAGGDQSR